MKKKFLCVLLALVFTTAMFSGCQSSGNSSTSNQSTSSGTAKSTTLQMWYHISTTQAKVLLSFLDKYQKENPSIKIQSQSVPFAEMKKQLSIGSAAGQLPDLALCDTVDNVSFAAMGVAQDITKEINAWGEIGQYYSGPKSSAMYNEKYYGIPYYSNCLGIMYNKELFDKSKVAYPTANWTWDDFINKTHQLTSNDTYGLTMCLYKSEEGTFNELPFFWQAGADWNNINSEGGIKALTLLNDLYKEHYMSKELISMTQADMCSSLFITGKSAMMVAGSWLVTNIRKTNPNLKFGVVPFPTVNGKSTSSPTGGGNILMLSKTNRDETWKLMKWLSSKENEQKYCEEAGYIPSRKDAADASETWNNDSILKIYKESLSNARARGPHPQWPQISSAIQFAVQDTLSGEKTPTQAANEAAEKIKSIK